MNNRAPIFGSSSFECPHCNALSHQDWYAAHASSCTKEAPANLWTRETRDNVAKMRPKESEDIEGIDNLLKRIDKALTGVPVFVRTEKSLYSRIDVENIHFSRCYSCKEIAVWRHDALLYPISSYDFKPNDDMPDDIKADFLEAASVVSLSPRGACALLRLAVQKLCVHLGGKGNDLNADIASLVQNGLSARVQQSLDAVRVIGNQAVHPAELNLKDDRETAGALFGIVNYIVENQITQMRSIDEIYNKIPESKRLAIEHRDAKALPAPKER